MRTYVKELMKAKKVTIRSLMDETGLSNQTILNARRNSDDWKRDLCKKEDPTICSCSLATLDRIAQALGVSVHDLFSDQPNKE